MRQNYKNLTSDPFCSSNPSINTILKLTLAVLVPQIIMLFVTESFNSVFLLACSIAAAQSSQICYALIKKTKRFYSWAVILQGTLVGMFLPAGYPPLTVFFAVFIVLLLQNIIYESFAQSWANTVVVILIVLYFINRSFFPPFLLPYEYFTYGNAGARLFSEGILQTSRFDKMFTGFFNNSIFHSWGMAIPEGYITLLWDSQLNIPAFRFNVLTLTASLVLVSYKAADSFVSYTFLVVYALSVYFFSLYPYGGIIGSGDILLALCTGGTLFTAFFLLGWFGTAPMTVWGKCMYGAFGGICMFCLCGAGTSSAGILFTLMFLNILSPAVQYIEDCVYSLKIHKILIQAGIKEAGNE